MDKCNAELCINWTGSGCICDVMGPDKDAARVTPPAKGGKIKGQIDIGFSGATHEFECDAPENWAELTEDERDDVLKNAVMHEFYNVSNSYAEYVED